MILNNYKIQKDIASDVGTFIAKLNYRIIKFGPLEVNCFSICFWIDVEGPRGEDSIYVKVPKIIFYDEAKTDLGEITEEDRLLAVNEFNSLAYLADHWDQSLGVNFVECLGFIKNHNAIITKRIKADFFFVQFRRYDSFGRPRSSIGDPVVSGLKRFASSLRIFHAKQTEAAVFSGNDLALKFDKYLDVLRGYDVNPRYLDSIRKYLLEYDGYSCNAFKVINFKGIDIRQIFTDSGFLSIIDPGKMSVSFSEAGIARFIVTCRILYWGSPAIILGACPSASYENTFLDEYYGSMRASNKTLELFIMKEILKHWVMAHKSLQKRNWNTFVKLLLKKVYIDRFYYRLVAQEISRLK